MVRGNWKPWRLAASSSRMQAIASGLSATTSTRGEPGRAAVHPVRAAGAHHIPDRLAIVVLHGGPPARCVVGLPGLRAIAARLARTLGQ